MKKGIALLSLISLLSVSCSVHEMDVKTTPVPEDNVFYASLESYSAPDTRVHVDEKVKILWDAEDRIAIFNKTSLNRAYLFGGKTGDNAGYFEEDPDIDVSGIDASFGRICAVYPYQPSTSISESGVLTLMLPSEQTYRNGTFGPGANTMVSVTDDNLLHFKNVGGYLVLKLYGEGVSVSSITLIGNSQEKLSGKATWAPAVGENPDITMDQEAGHSVKLTCETPVALGANEEGAVAFWMVVPPTHFPNGFKLMIEDPDHHVFIKDTKKDLAIDRNGMLRISPFGVVMNGDGLRIDDVYPHESNIKYKTTVDESTHVITVTLPTVTDFSSFVFDYDFVGEALMAGEQELESGVTSIDARQPVTLTVRNGEQGESYTLKVRNTGLPVVRITTPEGVTLEDIEGDPNHVNWREGATIRIENANGTIDLEGATMAIKGRGNASWKYNKRPYALKLDKKAKVLGMKKHKRWILLANWKDRTLLRNDAAFWLSKQSGLRFTVSGCFVELEINGEHRGNYYLCEQIKINENRLGLTEIQDSESGTADPYLITGPYLMEIDNNYDEEFKFLSGFYSSTGWRPAPLGLKYMFADPDTQLSSEAVAYMENYIKQMEALIKKIRDKKSPDYDGYKQYLDMDSAIWFMFINELTGNGDFFNTDGSVNDKWYGPHSTFLYKDRDVLNEDGSTTRSKLFMGPVWDFDYKTFISELRTTGWNGRITTEDRSHKWVGANQQNYYYYYLCKDPAFRERMLELWEQFRQTVSPGTFNAYIDQMAESISLSEEFNTELWGNNNTQQDQAQNGDNLKTFQEAVALMKQAFAEKLEFMDENLSNLNQ